MVKYNIKNIIADVRIAVPIKTDEIDNLQITSEKIALAAITLEKIAPGTAGEIIVYDASGNADTISVGTSGQVLKSNGSGSKPSFQDETANNFITKGCYATNTASSPLTLNNNVGISSITRTSIGLYVVNLSSAEADTNYSIFINLEAAAQYTTFIINSTKTTSSFEIDVRNINGARQDPDAMSIQILTKL